MTPARKRPNQSKEDYAAQMLRFYRRSDRMYGGGKKSKYTAGAEKRVLALGGVLPPIQPRKAKSFSWSDYKPSTPKRSQSDPKYNPLAGKKVTPELKAQIDRQIRLRKKYEEYRKKNRVEHSTPLRDLKPTQTKPYIARPPKKSSTSSLGKLFSKAKPASTRTPTSLFGSVARGPKKYNQAAYLSGLNTPSNTKKQSIYKPYAKGGGIRKPKYKD